MVFAAGLQGAIFLSHGCKLLGGLYLAAGASPRPTAILFHGVPGREKNLDVAYALRDAGWNCLYFHYRGCWGSERIYSFNGLEDDANAAIEWVLRQPSVDAGRLALVGHSMGGYLALKLAARDARIKALVSICPLVDPITGGWSLKRFEEIAEALNGTTAIDLKTQWEALPSVGMIAKQLLKRDVLLVVADQDQLFPSGHQQPLAIAIPTLTWVHFPDADHVFSTCRKQLVEAVVEWLIEKLGT